MRRSCLLFALTTAAIVGSAISSFVPPWMTAAHADVEATVLNGQKIIGSVFAGEDIRVHMPMAAGTEGKLKLTVSGSNVPVSFSSGVTQIFDPDGLVVPVDENLVFGPQLISKRRSTFRIKLLRAQKTGTYTLVLKTNTRVTLNATGKWKVTREKTVKFEGDENSGNVVVDLQQGSAVRIRLKTVSGDPPRVARFVTPSGSGFAPTQKLNKKGALTSVLQAAVTGTFQVDVGYQFPGVAGSYTGKLKFKTVKGLGTSQLRRRNPPGIVLSVLPSERSTNVDFGDTGIGVANPGNGLITLTSERGGRLFARAYDDQLRPIVGRPNAVPVVQQSDLQPGATLQGHRLTTISSGHVAVFTTASGSEVGLVLFNQAFQVTGIRQFTVSASPSAKEPFLTRNKAGDGIFLGLPASPVGHTVFEMDGQLQDLANYSIGIGGLAHRNGAAAQWNPSTQVFELWAPDSTTPGAASDLHRQVYSQVWDPTGADVTPIADPTVQETMVSALSIDPSTGASVVHYVVVRNTTSGTGEIHRRIYDAQGVEVPGSHAVLLDPSQKPITGLNRPTSIIVLNRLFLGFETPTGPQVLRFPLLR